MLEQQPVTAVVTGIGHPAARPGGQQLMPPPEMPNVDDWRSGCAAPRRHSHKEFRNTQAGTLTQPTQTHAALFMHAQRSMTHHRQADNKILQVVLPGHAWLPQTRKPCESASTALNARPGSRPSGRPKKTCACSAAATQQHPT